MEGCAGRTGWREDCVQSFHFEVNRSDVLSEVYNGKPFWGLETLAVLEVGDIAGQG